MSWKSCLFRLSLVAFLLGALTNEVLSQNVQPIEKEKGLEPAKQPSEKQEADEDKFGQMTLDEISEYHTTDMRAYMKRYRAAPTKKEKLAVYRTIPSVTTYQARLIELINENPGSEAGLEVVEWWYSRGGRRLHADTIMRLVLKNYSELKSIEKHVPKIVWHLPEEEAEKRLKTLIDVNRFDDVKASATYRLHELMRERAKELEGEAAEAVNAEVKTLQDSLYAHYADVTDSEGTKYVDLIDAVKFLTELEIGKPVPDIVGSDIDGVEFKLSQYAGKVRVISFWGHW